MIDNEIYGIHGLINKSTILNDDIGPIFLGPARLETENAKFCHRFPIKLFS